MSQVNISDMFIWPGSRAELILLVVDINKSDYMEEVATCLEIGHPNEWYHQIRTCDLLKIARKVV